MATHSSQEPLLAAAAGISTESISTDSKWPLCFQVAREGAIVPNIGEDFPDILGPFSAYEVPQVVLDLLSVESADRGQRWKLEAPSSGDSSTTGFRSVLKPLMQSANVQQLEGDLAPVVDITMSNEQRTHLGIPSSARTFCWSYPAVSWRGKPPPMDPDMRAVLALVAYGGFVYFDINSKIVKILSLIYDKNGLLRFDPPTHCKKTWTDQLVMANRFKPVTIHEVAAQGASWFAWVNPYERICGVPVGGEHGAFIYLDDLPGVEAKTSTRTAVFPEGIVVGHEFDVERGQGFQYVSKHIKEDSYIMQEIPSTLIKDLSLVYNGNIVRGFFYNPTTCQIVYDDHEDGEAKKTCGQRVASWCPKWCCTGFGGTKSKRAAEADESEDFCYARLYSLNSWWADLTEMILGVFTTLLDDYSTALFIYALLSTHEQGEIQALTKTEGLAVVAIVVFIYSLHFAFTYYKAQIVWRMNFQPAENEAKAIGEAGDIIISSYDKNFKPGRKTLMTKMQQLFEIPGPFCRRRSRGYRRISGLDRMKTFSRVLLLQYLGVKDEIYHLPMSVHPFQYSRPWAAFTKEQARLYMVSYPNKDMFLYLNFAGQELDRILILCRSMAFLLLKLAFSRKAVHGDFFTLLAILGPSIYSSYTGMRQCVKIFRSRHRLRRYLTKPPLTAEKNELLHAYFTWI